jgi:hypothetical protein
VSSGAFFVLSRAGMVAGGWVVVAWLQPIPVFAALLVADARREPVEQNEKIFCSHEELPYLRSIQTLNNPSAPTQQHPTSIYTASSVSPIFKHQLPIPNTSQ